MMTGTDVRGIWTYRSFANAQDAVGNFDRLKVWEAELYLEILGGNRIYGHLGERPAVATGNEPFLLVEGEVIPGNPVTVKWRARGTSHPEVVGWIYDYTGYLTPDWPDAPRQRPAIAGTVTRTVAHGAAPAGSVYSFVAVKHDFREPRTVIPLAKPVVDMLASAEHRYHHALWHGSRDQWAGNRLWAGYSEVERNRRRAELRQLGWQPGPAGMERPALSADRLTNGSGEDFLFMHRRMVGDVRTMDPGVGTWRRVPGPGALSSFAPGFKDIQPGNPDGYALPPPWVVPEDSVTTAWLEELRKTSTLYARFQIWETQYTDPRFLASVSLAELGWRIEWTIHNWMHMRWTSVTRDPATDPAKRGLPIPSGRDALDFDRKWLDPDYDHLGETFSSHVNPVFWRLHGWVDDRIDDWFRAHEAVRPGTIKQKEVFGVDWFEKDGVWVLTGDPWEGPRAPHTHSGHGHDDLIFDVSTMQKALIAIYGPEPAAGPPMAEASASPVKGPPQATWFKRLDD
jgi:hypothetical protein